ncbi:hypothetical protein DTO164E3_8620 [Paecilomyces variotii]|nr:hypothetical protein DTO164E3_8620 [Paecilomyces variotii]KAJ9200555.1 hypothetical protein DTO032I3_4437 [Paecilomyces variotii]KAJ9229469.1 hypothetical protein DTO169E5_8861 [Paecilomyces variotii]KAJ9278683.1 hypothetical protein DTO021D3_4306 [Paecilomyces variotii]KAJ9289588.1 hypothetical protein DTO021C3_2659 [Paecilomyces variotii]
MTGGGRSRASNTIDCGRLRALPNPKARTRLDAVQHVFIPFFQYCRAKGTTETSGAQHYCLVRLSSKF